jgi:translation elongation factor EF-1beta
VRLSEQDAVAEKSESCSSIHLALQQFGFGVNTFSRSIVMGQRDGGVDRVAVPVESAGEGVQVWQVFLAGGGACQDF